MDMEDIVALHVSLVNLAIKCYSDELGYVDKALGYCNDLVEKKGISRLHIH